MNCAVIDIGSNTIRMIICAVENGRAEIIANAREKSVLLDCVYDRSLNKHGLRFLCDTLLSMKEQCELHKCKSIHAFATSSLRNIDNGSYVRKKVLSETGIDIDIISGGREAIYDYEGLKHVKGTHNGAAIDLGGGSCQFLRYSGGELTDGTSLSIGSLRMYHAFIADDIPTPDEAQALYTYILKCLNELPEYRALNLEVIYAMGGTARCAVKLYKKLYSALDADRISAKELKRMYIDLISEGQKSADTLRKHFPDRVNSLIPGMITLCAICEYIGADAIEKAHCGVREGYLMKEIVR